MTLPQHVNPLTGAHYDQINAALTALNHVRQLIGAAQGTGLDTRAHSEMADHLERQLAAIKQNFFPSGRPKP